MVEQVDRDAAWPFRPEGYGPSDKPAWDAGTYDDMPAGEAIRSFRDHRIAAEARGMEKAAKFVEAFASVECGEGMTISAMRSSAKEFASQIRRLSKLKVDRLSGLSAA